MFNYNTSSIENNQNMQHPMLRKLGLYRRSFPGIQRWNITCT